MLDARLSLTYALDATTETEDDGAMKSTLGVLGKERGDGIEHRRGRTRLRGAGARWQHGRLDAR